MTFIDTDVYKVLSKFMSTNNDEASVNQMAASQTRRHAIVIYSYPIYYISTEMSLLQCFIIVLCDTSKLTEAYLRYKIVVNQILN